MPPSRSGKVPSTFPATLTRYPLSTRVGAGPEGVKVWVQACARFVCCLLFLFFKQHPQKACPGRCVSAGPLSGPPSWPPHLSYRQWCHGSPRPPMLTKPKVTPPTHSSGHLPLTGQPVRGSLPRRHPQTRAALGRAQTPRLHEPPPCAPPARSVHLYSAHNKAPSLCGPNANARYHRRLPCPTQTQAGGRPIGKNGHQLVALPYYRLPS